MSPDFLNFVKGVLEKLHLHEAEKKDPSKGEADKGEPPPPNKNLIFQENSKKTDSTKKTTTDQELSEAVRKISEQPKGGPK